MLGPMDGRSCPDCGGKLQPRRRFSKAAASGDAWAYLPATVVAVVTIAGALTLVGARPVIVPTAGPTPGPVIVWNVLQRHVLSMFMHEGLDHFLGNAFLFVLFGGAFTAVTGERHLLGIVFLSHLSGTLAYGLTTGGGTGIGLSLVVAALISATVVRFVTLLLGKPSIGPTERFVGGAFVLAVIAFYAFTAVWGIIYINVFDRHIYGWVAGLILEGGWVLAHRWWRTVDVGKLVRLGS